MILNFVMFRNHRDSLLFHDFEESSAVCCFDEKFCAQWLLICNHCTVLDAMTSVALYAWSISWAKN